jgi:hypothetical protein
MRLLPPRPGHPIANRAGEWIKHRPVLGALINKYQRRVKGQLETRGTIFALHVPEMKISKRCGRMGAVHTI